MKIRSVRIARNGPWITSKVNLSRRSAPRSILRRHADIAREIVFAGRHAGNGRRTDRYPDKRSLLRGKTMSSAGSSFLGGAAAPASLLIDCSLVDGHSSQKEQLLADRAKEVSAKTSGRTGRMGRFGKRGRQRRHPATGRRRTATSRVRQPHRPPDQRPDNVPDERPGRTARAHSAVVGLIGSEPQLIAPTSEPHRSPWRRSRPGAEISGTRAQRRRPARKKRRNQKFNLISLFAPFDPIIRSKLTGTKQANRNCIHPADRQQNTKTEAHD